MTTTHVSASASESKEVEWRVIDRKLRSIAMRRAGLDADEAHWLREAERLALWRELGHVSMLEYLEHVFGYTPHVAHERMRVARALAQLPELAEALQIGELSHSAIRELSRIARPATAAAWRAAARGKTVREIEELVAHHQDGDAPDDPETPNLAPRTVRFEVSPETYARLRQARQLLDGERGHRLDDDALVAALCEAVLDGTEREDSRGRAKFQIAVTTCRDCRRATQEGAGAQIAIDAAALARAECDAQRLGALDGVPARATQDVAPRVQRLVWRRDGGRCRVPGCRSSRHLELHHVVARVDGGDHDPENLTLLCDGHHAAHHRGVLTITGKAPDRLVFGRPDREPAMSHVGPTGPTNG